MEVDEQDYDEGGSGVMISNLPLVFARGMPSSLKTMKLVELEQFVGFMVRCSVGEERQVPWSQLPRPLWWPKKLPFRMPSAASHNQHQTKTTLVKLADMCYTYHGCQYLLQFCHSLVEQMPDSGYRFNDNRDGTTSMYHGTTGKLLVTFRNENREYDRFVADVPAPSPRKHNKLLPERRSSSTTNGTAFIPPPDIYLCDKCENEFYSLKEVQAHEKKCVGEEAETEKIPTPEPEQQEEEPEPQGQVPFLAYFKMKPAEHTGLAPYMSPRKRNHSPPRKKSFGQNYLRYDSVELASPLGRFILSNSKFGNKFQASQHLVSMRYERHLHATPNADLTYNYKDRSVRGGPDRNARSNRWIVVWREKKEEQPWSHTYPFTKHDRKEKFWALKYGLNRRSRMLYRQFSKGPAPLVKVKRLQKRVLDRYTRKNDKQTAVCIDLTDEPVGQPVQPSVLAGLLNANTLFISPAPAPTQRPMPASVAAAQRSGLSIRPMPASVAAAQSKPTAISPGRSSSSRPMPASVAAARALAQRQQTAAQQTAALLAQAAATASSEEDPLQINIKNTVAEQASAMFVQQGLVNPQQLLWNNTTVSQQLAAMQLPVVPGVLPNISFIPVNPVNNVSALNQIGNISIKTESGVSIEKVLSPVSKIRSNQQTVRTNASIEVIELSSSDDEDSNKTSRSVAANAPSQLDGLRHYPNMGAKVPDSSKISYPKNGNSHWSSQNKSHDKTSQRVVDLATNGHPPSISASSQNLSRVETSVDPKANVTLTCSVVRPNINTRRGKTPPCSHNDEQGKALQIESGRCKTTRGKRCSESHELRSTVSSEHNLSSGSLLVDSEISFKTPFQVDEEVYFMSPRSVDSHASELSTSSSTESDDGLNNSLTDEMASSSGFVANFINKSMDFLRSLVTTNTEKDDGSQSDENSPLKRELERLMKDECAELKGYKDLKDIDLRGKRFTRRSVGREMSRSKSKVNRRIHRSRKIRSYPDALAVSSGFEPALMENCENKHISEVDYNKLDKLSRDSLSFATDENGNSASYDSLHNPIGHTFSDRKKAQAKLKYDFASDPTMASEAESNGNVPSSPSKSKGKERKCELDRLQADEWKEMRMKGFHPSLSVKGEKDVNGNENPTLETKDPCLATRILEQKVGTFGDLSFQTFSDPDSSRLLQDHIKAQSCSFVTVDQPVKSNARPLSASSNIHSKMDMNSSPITTEQLKQDLVNINQEDWIEIANKQFPSLTFKLSNGELHDSSENVEEIAKSLSVNDVNYMTVNNFYGKSKYPMGIKITDHISSSECVSNKLINTNSLIKSLRSPKGDVNLKYLSVDNVKLNVDRNECQRQVSVNKITSSENFYNNQVLSPTPKLSLMPKRKRSLSFEEEAIQEKIITDISPNSKRKKASKCSREVAKLAADEWKEIRHQGFHPADLLSDEGEIVYLQFDDDDDDDDENNENHENTNTQDEEKQMVEGSESMNKENDIEVTKPKKLPRDLLALLSDECKEFKKPRGRGKGKANVLARGRRGKEPLKLPHSRRPPSLKRLQEAYGLQSKAGRNRSGGSNKPNEAPTRSAALTNAGHAGGPTLIGGELPMARSTRAQTSILNCVDVITPRGAHRNIIETEGAMCVVNYELSHI